MLVAALWLGSVVKWRRSRLMVWLSGDIVAWRRCRVAAWLRGGVVAWRRCGVAVWLSGGVVCWPRGGVNSCWCERRGLMAGFGRGGFATNRR